MKKSYKKKSLKKKPYKKKSYKKKSYKKKSLKKKSHILLYKIGDVVTIIVKPYKNGKNIKGVIKRILTKRKYHSRGHKVELVSGIIGRIIPV